MSRKQPTDEEIFAGLLLMNLELIPNMPITEAIKDKPDIQVGDDIGVEVVQLVSRDEKQRDNFVEKKLIGNKLSGQQAREVITKECRNKDKSAFLEPNGDHYISPCLPFMTAASGGGFNLQNRLQRLRENLYGKILKWHEYGFFSDRRCFVICNEYFFGIDSLSVWE